MTRTGHDRERAALIYQHEGVAVLPCCAPH
jgi:hypothetical protein